MLTSAQIAEFRAKGYLVLPDAVDPQLCQQLKGRVVELVADYDVTGATDATRFSTTDQSHASDRYFFESASNISFFFEPDAFDHTGALRKPMGEALNKLGHAMHDLDPTFAAFARQRWMAEAAASVGMEKPLLLQSMYIFKPPRIGGEVTPHTDRTFLWTDPASVIGYWVAIDDATIDNGCLWAIPGSHQEPPRSRFRRGNGEPLRGEMEVLDPTEYSTEGGIPLEASRGTAVLLDGQLVHWSQPNRSPYPRHAFTLHVIDGVTHYADDNWLQRRHDLPLRGFAPTP